VIENLNKKILFVFIYSMCFLLLSIIFKNGLIIGLLFIIFYILLFKKHMGYKENIFFGSMVVMYLIGVTNGF